ncbi:MAG: EAL domain-containing protein [Oscillospiraceae bacterium]|nr:EAL domain-containing protein [Oscillospiraceae bacterium]
MKDEKKRIKTLKILLYSGVGLLFALTLAAAFLETFESVAITVAVLATIGMILLLKKIFVVFEDKFRSIEEIIGRISGYAEVKYNKQDETAFISSKFSSITGIEVASEIVDDVDYKKIMTELVSSPSDAGPDIYMAARPESWVRISTFENDYYEFTMISDVSEYVSCRNIIKSLKYYDSDTGMLCRDAFIAKVRAVTENNRGEIGLISIIISGVDKVSSFKGTTAADKVVAKAAAFIKRFENPHNAFAGRTSTNEMCLLLTDTYEEGCKKYADKIFNGLSEIFRESDNSEYIHVYCGYALFNDRESDAVAMLAASDYAAYEAKTSAVAAPVKFDQANYVLRAHDFEKIQVFNTIVNDDKIDYHFQPVVDARTGEVFGYEALMRPHEINGIRLSPIEVITIAREQNVSDKIECLTMSNLLKFLSENVVRFQGKRLFINTIPNCFITDDEYEEIFAKYGNVFEKLIIEITEGSQITPESIELMRKRYSSKHALFALDDYGTGYANESTLLSIQPDFIKIDRSIVSNIDNDSQKRHLVANLINFAKNHGIKTLSEGIETRGELETVITLGIDYIQGYYTGRPSPVILSDIATDIRNELLDINLKNVSYKKKVYRVEDDSCLDIETLAVQGYTDIVAVSPEVNFKSNPMRSVNMRIVCEDGYCGTIRITDVNIFGLEGPVLTLGKNCDVTLEINGQNVFSYEGIRVPETSSFVLKGDGSLRLDVSSDDGTVLGGNYFQDYGKIRLEHTGALDIYVETSNIVGIGGSVGSENSLIEIISGKVTTELRGINIIAVGSVSGTAAIDVSGGSIFLENAGRNVVGIGSISGNTTVTAGTDIKAVCSGNRCCAVGVLDGGSGKVVFNKGKYELSANAKEAAVIGALGGNVDVVINEGDYNIRCEGNDVTGIGDRTGSGNVQINSAKMKLYTAASVELGIGSGSGSAVISAIDVFYEGRGKIMAAAPDGGELAITEVGENLVELHCKAV